MIMTASSITRTPATPRVAVLNRAQGRAGNTILRLLARRRGVTALLAAAAAAFAALALLVVAQAMPWASAVAGVVLLENSLHLALP